MKLWSRASRPPLSDLEHATQAALQSEYAYVCDILAEKFDAPDCDDLDAELAWYQSMKNYFDRLERVHKEFDVRRQVAAEMRKKYVTP